MAPFPDHHRVIASVIPSSKQMLPVTMAKVMRSE